MGFIIAGALIVGVTLGLLGSGGSAITVPVLLYMVGHHAKVSIAESMAIVGGISVFASLPYAFAKQIHWRSVVYFGIPGMFGTFVGAWLGGMSLAAIQLIVFGFVLIAAAIAMFRNPRKLTGKVPDKEDESEELPKVKIWKIAIEGSLVGVLTGFVGVGGGFLIVPALVILGRLPMKLAIGTSLVVIAIKSAVGFVKYQHDLTAHGLSIDWETVIIFTAIGIVASFIGKLINTRINQRVLKRVFAVFLVLIGTFVIVQQGRKILTPQEETTASEVQQANLIAPLQVEQPAEREYARPNYEEQSPNNR